MRSLEDCDRSGTFSSPRIRAQERKIPAISPKMALVPTLDVAATIAIYLI
jgi:hypothetical protein